MFNKLHSTVRSSPSLRPKRGVRRATLIATALALMGLRYLWACPPTEYQVKAAYLYNFGRFVEWPAKAGPADRSLFSICVLGDDPFGRTLDATIAGETIAGKYVVARRLSNPKDAAGCRILFISSSEDSDLKEVLAALDGAGVLTVSDIPQFAERGGMIQFVLENKREHFEVNLAAAERAGLSLSSQLLKVAIRVKGASHGAETQR